jgi:sodium borate transporter 11
MKRHTAIIRLKQPTNMGDTCHDVQLFVLILCPVKEVNGLKTLINLLEMNGQFLIKQKSTKNGLETGRTFATLLADANLRRQLLEVTTEKEFKLLMLNRTQELIDEQRQSRAAVPIKLDNDVQSKPKGVETKKVSFF